MFKSTLYRTSLQLFCKIEKYYPYIAKLLPEKPENLFKYVAEAKIWAKEFSGHNRSQGFFFQLSGSEDGVTQFAYVNSVLIMSLLLTV